MGNVNGINGIATGRKLKQDIEVQTQTEEPSSVWVAAKDKAQVTQNLPAEARSATPKQELSLLDKARIKSEKVILKSGTLAKHAGMPVAGELLELSLISDSERAEQVKAEGGYVLTPAQARQKLEGFGLKEGENGHTQTDQMQLQTLVFGKKSKMSQQVQGNGVLQNKVREWAKNGAKEGAIIGFNTADSGSFDLRMGLGYSQIVGLHLTSDGYAEGYVEDVYDYDPYYNKGKGEEDGIYNKAKSKAVKTLNDMAVDLQNCGELQRYRSLIPIRVKVQ